MPVIVLLRESWARDSASRTRHLGHVYDIRLAGMAQSHGDQVKLGYSGEGREAESEAEAETKILPTRRIVIVSRNVQLFAK